MTTVKPMTTGIEKSLPSCPNEYLAILKEKTPLAEKLTAIYTLALQDETFQHYKPLRVFIPNGYLEDLALYKSLDEKSKSSGWQKIQNRYPGYLKAKEESEFENKSNKHFLTEMYEFFKVKNMPAQAEKCRLRLLDFAL